MAQESRKDPRAKLRPMVVRYKSATVDEFIENQSHDVSRGGMFVTTTAPFPPGTLLKFELRVADHPTVMAGVGRVVWKRDPGQATGDLPAGMGVKFIKIDESSKTVIAHFVEEYAAAAPAEAPEGHKAEAPPGGPDEAAGSDEIPAPPMPAPRRASTMLGLGSIGASLPEEPAPAPMPEPRRQEASFFPMTNPEKEMPPPEERTVMKQAAELLQQALAEAGSSMDEIGSALAAPKPPPALEKAAPKAISEPPAKAAAAEETDKGVAPTAKDAAPGAASLADVADDDEDAAPEAAAPKAASKAVSEPPKPVEAKAPKSEPAPTRESTRPAAAKAPSSLAAHAEESGGSGKMLMILAAVVAIGGVAYLLLVGDSNDKSAGKPAVVEVAKPKPEVTEAPKPVATPAPPPAVTPAPSATPAPTASAAPAKTAEPVPAATPAKPAAAPPPAATPKPAAAPAPAKPTGTKPKKAEDPYE